MADVNEKVMKMVEEEVGKNPNVSTGELYEKAKKLDKSVDKLTARQFNARYPLQVKRRLAPRRRRAGGARRRRSTAEPNRGAVRQVMLQFAQAIASAEDPGQLVTLVADIDRYVDRVVKAAATK